MSPFRQPGFRRTRGPPALGFVPRPCDRFTLVEDEEAAGLRAREPCLRDKHITVPTGNLPRRDGPEAAPRLADARASSLYQES